MIRRTIALVALFAPALSHAQEPKRAPGPALEVRLTDGSRVRLSLLDETIALQTPHGRLVVPLGDVRRIEFAARLQETVRKQIDAAIADLGSPEMAKRESGGERLIKIGAAAYPAVLRATKSSDREQALSARRLREKFYEAFPEQRLPQHDMDVIHTDDAKIAGHIEATTLRALLPQFGEKTLKIADIASVHMAGSAPAEDVAVAGQPDPGNLTEHAQEVGKSFYFRVTGNTEGSVYGTDLYTTDSSLASAAVHAGVLKAGETGTVKVTIEPGQGAYTASVRNGVSSYGWGAYQSSYKVSRPARDDAAPSKPSDKPAPPMAVDRPK